jgi:hypothetical protein
MNTKTIKILVAILISLGVGFLGGMHFNAYQNENPRASSILEEIMEEEWNESRARANEASERSKKSQLLVDIILLESDLGTFRYEWNSEDIQDFSVEYMEKIKRELEEELSVSNNQ